jgi:hypothetical protein
MAARRSAVNTLVARLAFWAALSIVAVLLVGAHHHCGVVGSASADVAPPQMTLAPSRSTLPPLGSQAAP